MIVYFYIWVFTLPFRLQRMINNRLANMYARIDERYKYPMEQNDNFDYCLNPKCKSCRKLDQKLSQAETARRYLFTHPTVRLIESGGWWRSGEFGGDGGIRCAL